MKMANKNTIKYQYKMH